MIYMCISYDIVIKIDQFFVKCCFMVKSVLNIKISVVKNNIDYLGKYLKCMGKLFYMLYLCFLIEIVGYQSMKKNQIYEFNIINGNFQLLIF